jgi:hypothetical protein
MFLERVFNLDLIEGIQYSSRPLDMAFNSALNLEVATVVQNGSVYVWDVAHWYYGDVSFF